MNDLNKLTIAEARDRLRARDITSAELTEAYGALEKQVASLTEELAQANGELRRQYEEKARLTDRLSTLLNQLPAGVVVVDGNGVIEEANPAALDMDTETDAHIADIVQWTANSVAGHMLALVAPEKN